MINLYDHQLLALRKMKNGCILCGGVGSGKSITSLSYYYLQEGGSIESLTGGKYVRLDHHPKKLYIITTARKRDTLEWEEEIKPFGFENVIIDSWNNIKKYAKIRDSFVIFDEQRVSGFGVWAKSMIEISKNNDWILLSATPGDTWQDYITVFIANGFYKNKTEFIREHVVYKPYRTYPEIDRYVNVGRLMRLRRNILVNMDFKRIAIPHYERLIPEYDRVLYKRVQRERWDIFNDEPIQNAHSYSLTLRKLVNSDESRGVKVLQLLEKHEKAIIFYTFDYELDILRNLGYLPGTEVAEWNGHKHQPIPTSEKWVYLVQYNAGNEGWNCISTNVIIFYSLNHSYKMMKQAAGRIDRINTKFNDLYYYALISISPIDVSIMRCLRDKKDFNEMRFYNE